MKILETLLPIVVNLIELLILSACFGFVARILKAIFIWHGKQIDKIFAYLYTIIFYIPFIFKGINFLIKNLRIFFYDVTFLWKIFFYIAFMILTKVAVLSLTKIFVMMLSFFVICSKSEEDYDEINFFIIKGTVFVTSLLLIIFNFSFFIGGILKPIFSHSGLILKIFISLIFIIISLSGILIFIEYIKRFYIFKGKKKFLMKSFFFDENNKKSFFKFVVRIAEKENKIIIHYQENMSERKMSLDFYIDRHTFGEVFYEQTNTIFTTAFFEENRNLEDNKIFKLNFFIPRENIISFYYKDRYRIYKDKNSLLYSDIKLDYYPYLFLRKLSNNYEQIDLEFSYLEINEQDFFIEEYGKFTKEVKSFKKMNEFFINYFNC